MTGRNWLRTTALATAIGAGLAVVARAQPAVREVDPSTLPSVPEAVAADVRQLGLTLNDAVSTQPQRDEAARRLAGRGTPEATAILRQVLADASNPRGQLAVATALAGQPATDASFVAPLAGLLGNDARLAGAGAAALAGFKEDDAAVEAIVNYVRGGGGGANPAEARQREPARVAALAAAGTLPDRRAAAALVEIVRSDLEPDAVRAAAADALAVLSARPNVGRDPQRWADWWEEAGRLSDAEFRQAALTARAGRADRGERREQDLSLRLRALLGEQYLALPRDQKPAALARHLADDAAVVRAFAAELVVEEARNANPPTPATRERLRSMVGDSDPAVRLAVATTVRAINDPGALGPLRAQLAQELVTDVRVAQVLALGQIGDARAVDSILPLIVDPSDPVALAAARALATLGPTLRAADPAAATRARAALVDVIRGRAARPVPDVLRAAVVGALAPLVDASQTPLFLDLLRPREPAVVRVAALNALALIADPKAADRVADVIVDERDRDLRLAAVRAMGRLGTFDFNGVLLDRMDPAKEPDEQVRAAAWDALVRLLPTGGERGLKELADRFRQDPSRRLVVLSVLVDRLRQQADPDLASEQQNLGEVQMQVERYRDAADSFKAALDHWQAQNQPMPVVEQLIEFYIRALLKSGQYPEASAFATAMIGRDPSTVQTVGVQVRREADELRQRGELPGALRLIATFLPLKLGRYNAQLQDLQREIQSEQNAKTLTRPAGNARGPHYALAGDVVA